MTIRTASTAKADIIVESTIASSESEEPVSISLHHRTTVTAVRIP